MRIAVSEEAGRTRIPAMIVQTLVENAVKHGISARTGPGTIEVEVTLAQERIAIEVRDSGSGFAANFTPSAAGGGHGLRNIRDRLRGYFGDDAELRTGRDPVTDMTVASVEMPRFAAPLKEVAR